LKLVSTFLLAILTGCAASGPVFTDASAPKVEASESLIYIYRENTFVLGGREAHFYLDGQEIASLSCDGFTWFKAPAGHHTLSQNWALDILFGKKTNIKPTWVPGRTYFYKFTTESGVVSGSQKLIWRFMAVSPEVGIREISTTKYQPAKNTAVSN
jgi:hypothetical protein